MSNELLPKSRTKTRLRLPFKVVEYWGPDKYVDHDLDGIFNPLRDSVKGRSFMKVLQQSKYKAIF